MQTSTLIFIGLGLYLVTGIAKKAAAQRLIFRIQNIKAEEHGLNFYLTVNIVISNPTSQDFNVSSLSGSLSINGQSIGVVSSFQKTLIAANSQAIYPITIVIGLVGAGLDIFNLISNPSGGLSLQISGTANIEGVAIPVNVTDKVF